MARLQLKPTSTIPTGYVDDAWSPRSPSQAELLALLPVLADRLGSIEWVRYHLSDWGTAARGTAARGTAARASRPANEPRCAAVGNLLMSGPISARITSAAQARGPVPGRGRIHHQSHGFGRQENLTAVPSVVRFVIWAKQLRK